MTELCERCGMYPAARYDEWCDECILEVETIMAEEEEAHAEANGAVPVEELEVRYGSYNTDDLERWVQEYEEKYGIPSSILLAMWGENMVPVELPGSDRHIWLSFYRELLDKKRR